MMTVVLAGAIALPATAAVGYSGSTEVRSRVATRAYVTATADGILVRANTNWSLIVQTDNGFETFTGSNTPGTEISMSGDTIAYWIVTE